MKKILMKEIHTCGPPCTHYWVDNKGPHCYSKNGRIPIPKEFDEQDSDFPDFCVLDDPKERESILIQNTKLRIQNEQLLEEIMRRKKASTCPDCARLRNELERAQEVLTQLKRIE
jgi:hypothetical protein